MTRESFALCLICVVALGSVSNTLAFFPGFYNQPGASVAAPAPATIATTTATVAPSVGVPQTLEILTKEECPSDIVEKLQTIDFGSLSKSCPQKAGVPHDTNLCTQCTCDIYNLVTEALGAAGTNLKKLARDCGPVFSLDTAIDGANAKAITDFLGVCQGISYAVPQRIDYKTCTPVSANSRLIPTDDKEIETVLSFLTTDLTGVTTDEVLELMAIGKDVNLADNTEGIVTEISQSAQVVKQMVDLMHNRELIPESLNDSSILCPGFATAGGCESFTQLRNVCPWSCERQKDECASYASLATCRSATFQQACPVTCNHIEIMAEELPMTLEGAGEVTQISDGSAIKAHNLRGTVETGCMCFKVFQPICDLDTGDMYSNLCEAECNDVKNIGSCRATGNTRAAVAAFSESSLFGDEDFGILSVDECDKHCPKVYDPVCTEKKKYKNVCLAECDFEMETKPCQEDIKYKGTSDARAGSIALSMLALIGTSIMSIII